VRLFLSLTWGFDEIMSGSPSIIRSVIYYALAFGKFRRGFSAKVTHVIAHSMAASKVAKQLKLKRSLSSKSLFITSCWVLKCLEENKRVQEHSFLLFQDTSLSNLNSYFSVPTSSPPCTTPRTL
jgi:hypothetical protein